MDNLPGINRRKVFCIIDCNSPSSLRDCSKPSSFAALEWPDKGRITSPSISEETPMILDNKSARLPFKIEAKGYIYRKLVSATHPNSCELVTHIIAAIEILVIQLREVQSQWDG